MTSKKSGKKQGSEDKQEKKPRRGKMTVVVSESAHETEPTVTPAEAGPKRTSKAHRKTAKPSKSQTPTTPTTDGTPEIVVFAFRLTRAERDEIHAATGSAKASRFVKAIVLAGARGDMKAVQEAIDEINANR